MLTPLTLWPLPLDVGDININAIIIAFLIVIWVLSTIVQTVQRVARSARERFRDRQEGRPTFQHADAQMMRPQAPPQMPAEKDTQDAEASTERRDMMHDLETILRDQLGLDLTRLGPPKPEQAPAVPAAPAPPPETRAHTSMKPAQAFPRAGTATPPQRSVRPARPAHTRRAVPAPRAAPTPEPDFELEEEPARSRPAPAADLAPAAVRPALQREARAATQVHHEGAYVISTTQGSHQRTAVRALLSGPSRRQAILIQEIMGAPRAERGWE